MPKSLPRTHPFFDSGGRLFRVVERDGVPSLEDSNGDLADRCYITGPEILKLAEHGRALWDALSQLLAVIPPLPSGFEWDEAASARAVADVVLGDTAATFDHNVPEVPRGDD